MTRTNSIQMSGRSITLPVLATLLMVFTPSGEARAQSAATPTPKPRTTNVQTALAERIPEASLQDVPLEDALAWIADVANVNVVVRWADLEQRGVERDKPVSVKLRNVRIYHALRVILSEAGGPDVALGFRIDAETLTISTADQVDIEMVLKTYDVSDLLFRVRRFRGPTIDPTAGGQGQQAGVLTRQDGDGVETPPAGDEAGGIDGLIRLITNVVEPDSWTIHGGRGTIEAFGSQIVVWNTVAVHQRLGGPVVGVHVDVAR